ncbi:MAG: hypothetical protein ACJ735_10375 [Actinomycetes bacterium]
MRRRTTAVLVAASALSLFAVTGQASAGTAHHPRSTAGVKAHIGASPNTPSTNYGAGYFSYLGTGNVVSVGATFKAPPVTCASTSDMEWLLPGIWIYDGGGNLSEQVDVNLNCNSGSQLREDVICLNGVSCDTSLTINPNDKVEVSFTNTPNYSTGVVRDITQHTSATVTGPSQASDYTVFIGDEGPSLFGPTAVPTFTKVGFSIATVNGQYLGDNGPAKYNLKTTSAVQIATGALNSSGSGFNTTFKHN